ncbi:hypothetical protein [Hyphomonas sp.]|uniref:hypothetical protein n=1 Tax=Hyphomonas sp. TaxID=87 RepID=UPI003299B561
MAAAAEDVGNAAAAADAAAFVEAENSSDEDVALAEDEIDRGGANIAIDMDAGSIQGGIEGQQSGITGEGAGKPMPAADQTQKR